MAELAVARYIVRTPLPAGALGAGALGRGGQPAAGACPSLIADQLLAPRLARWGGQGQWALHVGRHGHVRLLRQTARPGRPGPRVRSPFLPPVLARPPLAPLPLSCPLDPLAPCTLLVCPLRFSPCLGACGRVQRARVIPRVCMYDGIAPSRLLTSSPRRAGRFNGLGDRGATALAEGLRHTPNLRCLGLWCKLLKPGFVFHLFRSSPQPWKFGRVARCGCV
jgi:hypothetical protein